MSDQNIFVTPRTKIVVNIHDFSEHKSHDELILAFKLPAGSLREQKWGFYRSLSWIFQMDLVRDE